MGFKTLFLVVDRPNCKFRTMFVHGARQSVRSGVGEWIGRTLTHTRTRVPMSRNGTLERSVPDPNRSNEPDLPTAGGVWRPKLDAFQMCTSAKIAVPEEVMRSVYQDYDCTSCFLSCFGGQKQSTVYKSADVDI